MSYYLFLDDERKPEAVTWVNLPKDVTWVVVKNYKEFTEKITKDGLPNFVTFDHDLGKEHYLDAAAKVIDYSKYKEFTGMECAKWLVDYCLDNRKKLPKWSVHTMNVCGKTNITSYLESFDKCQEKVSLPA